MKIRTKKSLSFLDIGFSIKPALLAMVIMAIASAVSAQTPTRIKQHNAWGAYSYKGSSGKICYILSVPVKKEPKDRDHGGVFFMLAKYSGANSSLEPQFRVGYPFKKASKVSVKIDDRTFSMFTKGNNAWVENRDEEKQVVAAMRAGKDMLVSGTSSRGTNTRYTYSLSGVTASLKEVATCSGS